MVERSTSPTGGEGVPRAPLPRFEQAEFVALGIEHHPPAVSFVVHVADHLPAQLDHPPTGGLHVLDAHVEVQPVLGRLGFGDPLEGQLEAGRELLEEDVGSPTAADPDAEHAGPELGQRSRVAAVDGHVLQPADRGRGLLGGHISALPISCS